MTNDCWNCEKWSFFFLEDFETLPVYSFINHNKWLHVVGCAKPCLNIQGLRLLVTTAPVDFTHPFWSQTLPNKEQKGEKRLVFRTENEVYSLNAIVHSSVLNLWKGFFFASYSIMHWFIKKFAGNVWRSQSIKMLNIKWSRHFREIFCLVYRKSNTFISCYKHSIICLQSFIMEQNSTKNYVISILFIITLIVVCRCD